MTLLYFYFLCISTHGTRERAASVRHAAKYDPAFKLNSYFAHARAHIGDFGKLLIKMILILPAKRVCESILMPDMPIYWYCTSIPLNNERTAYELDYNVINV